MHHPSLKKWEDKLHMILRDIDRELESKYGDQYPLHPSRRPHGTVANPKYDGLFQVSTSFTAGFGSELGRGYLVEVRMVTLKQVPSEIRRKIEDEVAEKLRARLPSAFPGRNLEVNRDGRVYKIHGDLSLGEL